MGLQEEEEANDREYFECIIEEIKLDPDCTVAKKMPDLAIVKYHDILDKLWGWEKLVPMDVSWDDYRAYLEVYLSRNVHAISSIPTLAQACLHSEEQLVSEWKIQSGSEETWSMRKSNVLSCLIHERVRSFIDSGCSFSNVSGAALLCIAKEADLTTELLRCGVDPVDDYFIDQGREIRTCALGLMNCTLDNSVAASALMLGMANVAERIRVWINKNNEPVDISHHSISGEIEDSRIVRYRTLDVMIDILEKSSSSAAAWPKIDNKEPASRNGPVGDGDGFAANGAANTTGGGISDVLNSRNKKIIEAGKMSKKRKMEKKDLLENVWGWGRLLPLCGSVKLSGHSSYLEEYYKCNADEFLADAAANQNPEEYYLGAAVAKVCLEMEKVLLSQWNTRFKRSLDDTLSVSTIIQSSLINQLAHSICSTGADLCVIAFVCITKEADLMCELLKHRATLFDDMIEQSSVIRTCALGLANLKGNQRTVAAAAMVGIANEAKMMCDWMKREKKLVTFSLCKPNDQLEVCRLIRVKALDFITSILHESSFPSSKMHDDDAMVCN